MAMTAEQLKNWAYGQLHMMGFNVASAAVDASNVVRAEVSVGDVGNRVKVRHTVLGWVAESHCTPGTITNSLHDRRFGSKHELEDYIRSLGLG